MALPAAATLKAALGRGGKPKGEETSLVAR